MKDCSNEGIACTCRCAASALAQMWLTDVHVAAGHAAAPCGNGARSTSRLRTRLRCAAGAAPPSTALRVRSAAIQRRAEAGAAGACVSAAPAGVPRGRRAFKGAAKVAGKGTPLPGGALWAHFRKLGGHWSQLCNLALNAVQVI